MIFGVCRRRRRPSKSCCINCAKRPMNNRSDTHIARSGPNPSRRYNIIIERYPPSICSLCARRNKLQPPAAQMPINPILRNHFQKPSLPFCSWTNFRKPIPSFTSLTNRSTGLPTRTAAENDYIIIVFHHSQQFSFTSTCNNIIVYNIYILRDTFCPVSAVAERQVRARVPIGNKSQFECKLGTF